MFSCEFETMFSLIRLLLHTFPSQRRVVLWRTDFDAWLITGQP
jgi:hypothetical protein